MPDRRCLAGMDDNGAEICRQVPVQLLDTAIGMTHGKTLPEALLDD